MNFTPPHLAHHAIQAMTEAGIRPGQHRDGDALLQPASRAALRRLLKAGWIDAIRTIHPAAPMYTFWDYKRKRWERDAGLRLDHLLLSLDLAGRLHDASVDRALRGEAGASEHVPARITLRR